MAIVGLRQPPLSTVTSFCLHPQESIAVYSLHRSSKAGLEVYVGHLPADKDDLPLLAL